MNKFNFFATLIILGLSSYKLSAQIVPSRINVDSIVNKMTLEEKIDFIGGFKEFNIRGYAKYGIPEVRIADGPVGIRNYGKATAYPSSITLAASFNRQMGYNLGKAIANDARERNAHIMLGPGMNIYRMSIAGRNFEYLGEDPYLAGQMAVQYIKGVQDMGVIACAKHFAANNHERNRHHCSSNVDERTLNEIYLPAFKASVQEGKVATVMTSYNLINGVQATENDSLNNKVLRDQWGFDGFIVSDWASTYHALPVANGGVDLEMPSGAMMNRETLIPAIKNGELKEELINDKVRRILFTYARFGLFEHPDLRANFKCDTTFTRNVAKDVAREGVVLLKNANNSLPLNINQVKSVAVLGPYGAQLNSGGRGSSYTDPLHPLTFLDALKQVAPQVNFVAESGIFVGVPFPDDIFKENNLYVKRDGQKVKGATADYYLGKALSGEIFKTIHVDKVDLADETLWNPAGIRTRDFSVRFTSYFTPSESGYYCVGGCGDDGYRILVDDVVVVDMWQDQGPTNAKHDMFMNGGQEYKIVEEYYQAGGGGMIQLGVVKAKMDVAPEQYTNRAIEIAKASDWVIMPVGFSAVNEGEAADRTFEMPYNQAEFINKVAAVNPNVIVVVTAGGGFETASWIYNVKGLLLGWYPGQEGTLASAEILFGITNPSGKLPISIENRIEDTPWYTSYFTKDDTKVDYIEGLSVGYRFWDKSNIAPAFPFGFGLSYTSFEIGKARVNQSTYKKGDIISVSLSVKNSGNVRGSEVIQLYSKDLECSVIRPEKELKGFEKVVLDPGETKTVTITLPVESLAFYDVKKHDWNLEAGKFELQVGTSSRQIAQNMLINVK